MHEREANGDAVPAGGDDELSAQERAALDALPRERPPSDLLEERVVRALRAEGLLLRPARRGFRPGGAWWVAAVAAGVALFAGGVALGQALAARSTAQAVAAVRDADARATAALVQRTGSAYVTALAALADQHGSGSLDSADARQGSEVALAALRSAAEELARLDPDNALARQVVLVLEEPGAMQEERRRQVIWF